jgi:hypothetical protein
VFTLLAPSWARKAQPLLYFTANQLDIQREVLIKLGTCNYRIFAPCIPYIALVAIISFQYKPYFEITELFDYSRLPLCNMMSLRHGHMPLAIYDD